MEALISLKGATGLKFSKNELNYPSAFANNDYSLFSLRYFCNEEDPHM